MPAAGWQEERVTPEPNMIHHSPAPHSPTVRCNVYLFIISLSWSWFLLLVLGSPESAVKNDGYFLPTPPPSVSYFHYRRVPSERVKARARSLELHTRTEYLFFFCSLAHSCQYKSPLVKDSLKCVHCWNVQEGLVEIATKQKKESLQRTTAENKDRKNKGHSHLTQTWLSIYRFMGRFRRQLICLDSPSVEIIKVWFPLTITHKPQRQLALNVFPSCLRRSKTTEHLQNFLIAQ